MSQTVLNQRTRSLRKRIWWIIYVSCPSLFCHFKLTAQTRERHASAAFGRPCRIRDEDCDVEFLTNEDFMFDLGYDQSLIPVQQDYHVLYVIEMAKLANIRELIRKWQR